MGDMADDMIDGSACSLCGMYFQDRKRLDLIWTHGYPVLCKECWDQQSPEDRKGSERAGLQRAIAETI